MNELESLRETTLALVKVLDAALIEIDRVRAIGHTVNRDEALSLQRAVEDGRMEIAATAHKHQTPIT